ncbi:MAG: class I mannose-6-phosphate isomerase [Planctomycetota bacterium]|nr:class I mannose-6-phosphate isomerase [Planctomycetota bacterium]
MPQPPLLLSPILKRRRWGGTAIAQMLEGSVHDTRHGAVAEAWLAADLPESIADGVSAGQQLPVCGSSATMTLRAAMESASRDWMGEAIPGPDGRFPLLIKILDAADNLSVQVHPDAAYARSHPEAHMKSEAWIVLRHDPGAVLYRGLAPTLTRAHLRGAMESGSILQSLITLPARVGDTHWLPSGICHALGAGITAFEVQTPSDTTFRAWDWNRNDPARELHIDEAEACTLLGASQHLESLKELAKPGPSPVGGASRLVETPFFAVDRVDLEPGDSITFTSATAPRVAWCWSGLIAVEGSASGVLPAGFTIAIAAATEPITLTCSASCANRSPAGGTILVTTAATAGGSSLRAPGFGVAQARRAAPSG